MKPSAKRCETPARSNPSHLARIDQISVIAMYQLKLLPEHILDILVSCGLGFLHVGNKFPIPVVVQHDERGSLAGAKAETIVVDNLAVKAQLEGQFAASENHVARAGVPLEEFRGGKIALMIGILHNARRHYGELYGNEGSQNSSQCPARHTADITTATDQDRQDGRQRHHEVEQVEVMDLLVDGRDGEGGRSPKQ